MPIFSRFSLTLFTVAALQLAPPAFAQEPRERAQTYVERVALTTDPSDALARWDGTAEGRGVWKAALSLREALRTMAERLAAGRSVGPEVVGAINAVLAARPTYPELVAVGRRWVRRERVPGEAALHLLAPVAASAAWLLEHGDPALLRKCENPDCVLYFYDTTKNKRRRWCSMDGCGARAKAAAYYRRERRKAR